MLEQTNAYCPHCARPQRAAEAGNCDRCGRWFDAPYLSTIGEILSAPRRPCQSCCRSILIFTAVCERCLVIQDRSAPAPRSLPPLLQGCLDHRTYEDNFLYVVLPDGAPEPDADALIAEIQRTDLHISDAEPASRHRGHRPRWEWVFSAQDPERPFQRWESGPRGVSPRAGERIHIWLEETGLPADMGLQASDGPPEVRAWIHASRWTIGLHCDTTDDPSWNTRLMMRLVRCLLPEQEPMVIERATGRVLLDVWREAAELKPPPLQKCYATTVTTRDGFAWLRTRGLPRWGCFELEVLGVPDAQVDAARQLIDAVAAMLVPMAQLPPPWRAMYFPNGAGFAWVPIDHVADRFQPDLVGTMRSERRGLKHATVVLVSPYFQPELFAEIEQQPAPPTARSVPETATVSAAAVAADQTGAFQVAPPPLQTAAVSPLVAALASLLFPGLGQILLGQTAKGAAVLAVALFTCGGLGVFFLLAAFDAWTLARRQQERPLQPWECFWS